MRTVTYDRSAAVNLARNVLKFKADKTITAKGVRILCEAVIGMDAALAAAPDHPDAAGDAEDAEDAARYRWVTACKHVPWGRFLENAHEIGIDAAIDAAMRASKGAS